MQLGLESESLYIGTVGNLRPVKNHALLLRVSQEVCRRYQHVRFVLIGHGPLRQQLASYAQELGIQRRVQFLGARSDIPEILNALDIFVLPSLSEGLPISVLEAMACGLPVVATQVGGLPEVIEDGKTGLLVPSQDEKQLAFALEVLIQHEIQRKMLGEQGRKRVLEHFSLQKMTTEYQELYESLVAESGV
jgi:glycosyltransferase involved in cell wall biosynthesis